MLPSACDDCEQAKAMLDSEAKSVSQAANSDSASSESQRSPKDFSSVPVLSFC